LFRQVEERAANGSGGSISRTPHVSAVLADIEEKSNSGSIFQAGFADI